MNSSDDDCGLLAWHPAKIDWQEIAPDGTRYSLLEGRRDIAGEAFTYAFFIPGGFWDRPHWHSATSRIFVVQGVLSLGTGDIFDPSKTIKYPAGSLLLVPAEVIHFDGSEENTLIFGTALGAWSTHYLANA